MGGSLGVFRAESLRLRKSRAVLLSALALALLAALRVALGALSEKVGAPSAPPEVGNAYGPLADGWGVGLRVGTLLLLVLSSRSLSGDREQGILRLATTRSVTRGGLVWGRALLGIPACLALVALCGLGAGVAAWAAYDFGPLREFGYTLMSREELDAELAQAVLASLPPLFAVWCFGLLVSALVRSPTGAVGTALAAFLGFDLFKELLGTGQHWVFAAFSPSFVDGSCMGELAGVARGLSDAGYSEALYRMNLVLPLPEAALMLAIAAFVMSRRAL